MKPVSRRTHSQDSKTTRPRKASAPQAGGTAEGSSRARAASGMKPNEEKLAGYLMARAATHQKVEGQDLTNLRVGNGTVQQVHDLLPLGRANVIEDLEKAPDAHLLERKTAADKLTRKLMEEVQSSKGEVTESDFYRAAAAASLHSKTGTCGSYSALSAPLHAFKIARMQDESAIVAQAVHGTIDHGWTEMIPKGMGADGKPLLHDNDVIMDGWSKEHLAVLREDSQFARLDKEGKADQITHKDVLNHRTGLEASNEVGRFKARIDSSMGLRHTYQKRLKLLVDANIEVQRDLLWNSTSIFHADFQKQAGMAVHPKAPAPEEGSSIQGARHEAEQAKRATLPEIQAVGVARSLGEKIPGAVAKAPEIIASAKDMFPDPR
ncbi:MAG TPA: hypothetical protein VK465_18100 [Fibrobacteria bacterium]|nr:hypothetical protein [Fibrobacteria bacterium]